MNLRKASASLLATGALMSVAAGAHANNTIAQFTGNTPGVVDINFSGGIGGTLVTAPGGANVTAVGPIGGPADTFMNSTLVFGPITQTGAAVNAAGTIVAPFSGGSFQLTSGAQVLLTGSFTGSTLTSSALSSASVLNLGLNSVTYTGGLFYTEFLGLYGGVPPVTGNLALSLASINPNIAIGAGGGLNAFGASAASGVFDATTANPIPEPGEIAFAVTFGAGLMGLVARSRFAVRRNKRNAASAA